MERIILLILTVLAAICTTNAYVTCPDDWTRHGFSCYFLKSCDVTWDDGERECIALGGHLVSVDTAAEQNFLTNFATAGRGPFWIGLNDKFQEGQWFFTDMRRLRPELSGLWADNEPNNKEGKEHCVVWPYGSAGKWNDAKCNNKYSFICEIELYGCPDGWASYGDSCYHKVPSPKINQHDAQVHCQSIHPDCSLAKIDDHNEQAFVEGFLGGSCADWIGLIGELPADDGAGAQHHNSKSSEVLPRDWYFTDGQPLVHDFWKSGEPNFSNNNARVCTIQKNDQGWNDYGCNNDQSFVCELKRPSF